MTQFSRCQWPLLPPSFSQLHGANHHAPVHCLAHIVDGEQADTGGSERFHFHTGLTATLGSHVDADATGGFVQRKFNSHTGEGDGVAQRNQVGSALGGHDGGDAGNAQHVASL
jgi:hypothetical protein